MRFAIFGDIHANLEALAGGPEGRRGARGDALRLPGRRGGVQRQPARVRGDHPEPRMPGGEGKPRRDGVAGRGPRPASTRSPRRRSTGRASSSRHEDKQWLRELKMVRQVRDFTIVHATLDTPHKWGYVFNQLDAAASFNYQHTQLCFYGHTHSPRAYIRDSSVRTAHLEKLHNRAGQKVLHQRRQRRPAARWRLARRLLPLHARQAARGAAAARIRYLDGPG